MNMVWEKENQTERESDIVFDVRCMEGSVRLDIHIYIAHQRRHIKATINNFTA